MTVSNGARFGLFRWSAGTDPFIRTQFDSDNAALESTAAMFSQGTMGARPAYGKGGRFYLATDTGVLFYDSVTAWLTVAVTGDIITSSSTSTLTNKTLTGPTITGGTATAQRQVAYTEAQATTTGAINCSLGTYFTMVLGGAASVSFTNIPAAPAVFSLVLKTTQDAAGGRTITWPAAVKWPGGNVPSMVTTPNAVNVFTLLTDDGGTTWQGYLSGKDLR